MTAPAVTALLASAGLVVATSAAVRSTWSPCGLSMLSTLTPVGERSRGHGYGPTVAWFVAGATLGGASLGLLVAGAAGLVGALHLAGDVRLWAAGLAALVAAASDTGVVGRRLPVHRRQVNERWLDGYRPWVYGAGFGWQIGAGLVTAITSAAVYLTAVLGALTGSPVLGLAVCTWFGLLRGLAVLLTRHLRTAADLLDFHRRFEAALPRADRAVRASELAVVALAASAVASPAALAVLAVPAVGIVGALLVRRARPPDRRAVVPATEAPAPSR